MAVSSRWSRWFVLWSNKAIDKLVLDLWFCFYFRNPLDFLLISLFSLTSIVDDFPKIIFRLSGRTYSKFYRCFTQLSYLFNSWTYSSSCLNSEQIYSLFISGMKGTGYDFYSIFFHSISLNHGLFFICSKLHILSSLLMLRSPWRRHRKFLSFVTFFKSNFVSFISYRRSKLSNFEFL